MQNRADKALADTTFFPFWLDRPDAPAPAAPLIGATKADLLIVGGGFTGLWAAIQAKETDPSCDVVLIESDRIAHGASGRPGGIVSTSVMHGLGNAQRIFPKDLDALEALGHDNMAGFTRTIDQHGIDANLEWTGEMTVAVSKDAVPIVQEEYDLHREHGHDVELLDAAGTRAQLNSPLFEGAIWSRKNSGIVHPARLAWGLRRAAIALGVRLHELSPMLGIDDQGNTLVVRTRDGEVRAPRVMLCTNAFAEGHKRIKTRVAMVRDRILTTEPLNAEQKAAIGWINRQGVYDTRTQLNYMRLTPDDRILFGGRLGYFANSPRDPRLDRTPAPYGRLAEAFFTTFPQLEGIRFSHAWSGPIALTTRMAVHFQSYYGGKAIYAGGYSGFGVSASRFGARVGLAKLAGLDLPETRMEFAATEPNWIPPEPFRAIGAKITMVALDGADAKGGWRKPWLAMCGKLGFPLS
ncbi:FAD-dependent oxidoreductase [Paracoccus litorisediminis]|uniref:FAD-dependent oxidoreductase n=1 Tax=Paracoccus litorisediminis TaxID=2006130 RepID=A0A844HKL8_9RHOB|nr:FAD-dependent oxidoreductase [Paracoccus litorisediminis]MTH60470.1 FAD-dependent oxidoreductase [Paracoccus litorisediminis]